ERGDLRIAELGQRGRCLARDVADVDIEAFGDPPVHARRPVGQRAEVRELVHPALEIESQIADRGSEVLAAAGDRNPDIDASREVAAFERRGDPRIAGVVALDAGVVVAGVEGYRELAA